jgi:hypothetical protein
MKISISKLKVLMVLGCFLGTSSITQAATVGVNFTRLSGSVAQGTAIFRADLALTGFEDILSITLIDSNSKTGGSKGQYSGFDLDAIKLSNVFATTASGANSAVSINEFDFNPTGTIFIPGSQRAPTNPKLNGTDASGLSVDPAFATLNSFDAIFFGTGSVTLGDGGSISFNLKNAVPNESLYLYIGEVSGSSGEALNGTLLVSDVATVPVPGAFWLFSPVILCLARITKRNNT